MNRRKRRTAEYYRVHNYYVGDRIANGSFGSVYEAFKKNGFDVCAIRMTSKRRLAKYSNAKQLIFNIKTLAPLLRHDQIAHVSDVVECKGQIFQVMELYSNGNLLCLTGPNRPERHVIIRMIDEVLAGVEYLHSLHLCHRDIKPENVLVTDDMHARLSDFDFCAFTFDQQCMLCGSQGYVAPEVEKLRAYDGVKADIWSCGMLICRMFSEKPPVDFKDIAWDTMPSDVADLVKGICKENPSERPAIEEIRAHQFFGDLKERAAVARIGFDSAVEQVSPFIVDRMCEVLMVEPDDIVPGLMVAEATREKVLYHLIGNYMTEAEELHVSDHQPNVHSLPSADDLHGMLNQGIITVSCYTDSMAKVRDAVESFFIERGFCLTGHSNGSKTVIQNRDSDDVVLELGPLAHRLDTIEFGVTCDPAHENVVHELNARMLEKFHGLQCDTALAQS